MASSQRPLVDNVVSRSKHVRPTKLETKAIYTHLLDFRQLFGPAVARVRRRRRGRRPGVRHRQVEHIPLALGRVRVAAAAYQLYMPVNFGAPVPASSRLQYLGIYMISHKLITQIQQLDVLHPQRIIISVLVRREGQGSVLAPRGEVGLHGRRAANRAVRAREDGLPRLRVLLLLPFLGEHARVRRPQKIVGPRYRAVVPQHVRVAFHPHFARPVLPVQGVRQLVQ